MGKQATYCKRKGKNGKRVKNACLQTCDNCPDPVPSPTPEPSPTPWYPSPEPSPSWPSPEPSPTPDEDEDDDEDCEDDRSFWFKISGEKRKCAWLAKQKDKLQVTYCKR